MKRGPRPQWGRASADEQIIAILRQADGGVPVAELCRKHGMSNASFYKWRAKFDGMAASLISQMKAIDRAIGAPLVQAQWRGRTVG